MTFHELALGPRIKRISNALDRMRTRDLEDLDLTSSQGFVLGYLARHRDEAVYPVDLGRAFGLSHPTVTGILRRLEAKGFLAYADDPDDRRKKRLVPTEKALDCHQRVLERFRETETLLSAGMEEAELDRLRNLLDRVLNNLGDEDCAANPAPKEGSHD